MAGFQWERDELSILKAKIDSGELISRAWGEKAIPGRTAAAIRRMAVKLSSMSVDEFLADRKEGTAKERPTGTLIPDASRPIDILLADRERDFERKAAHHLAKRDVKITMPDNGPYLAVGVGDVHIDNPGCDIKRFRDDIDFINGTDRTYGFGVGDWSDNWSGYLERLYAASPSTKSEAEKLMKWSLTCIDWLFVIFGNHDAWTGQAEAFCKERGIVGVRHGGTFNLVSGEYNTRINCRHMHRGNSQYDPAFAAKKQAYRGNPADLIISGHYHTSASGIIANGVAGTLSHTVRVGAYKVFDDYQEANGFDDDTIGPASFHVVRPYIVGPGKLTTFWDRDTAEMLLHAAVDEWEQIKEEL